MRKNILLTFAVGASIACSGAPNGEGASQADEELSDVTLGTRVHVLPLHASNPVVAEEGAEVAAAAGAHLQYFGGPVISTIKVQAVYWGSKVKNTAQINAFFPAVTNSTYFDWLKEYNTSKQKIGRGTFGGAHTIVPSTTATSLTDAQIQKEIAKQIAAKKLPASDANTVYMVYFAPGVSITGPSGAGQSCVDFCAYHGTFVQGGKDVMYGVMPDLTTGGCATGCGGGTAANNITEVSSHEMIEATTDPAVGLATTNGPPLAWYDPNNGEIGDICVGQAGKVGAFTVQLEWSNARNKCVAK